MAFLPFDEFRQQPPDAFLVTDEIVVDDETVRANNGKRSSSP